MSDTLTSEVDDVGTVHRLDDHRTPPVQLTKDDQPQEVLEGVVLPAGTTMPAVLPDPRWRRSARRVRIVATHDRTKNAGRLAVRHGAYVVGGTRIIAKRTWDGRTVSRHERMMRGAEAAGQHEVAMEWELRAAAFRDARHKRRMELLKAPQQIVKGAAIGTAATAGGLLGLGIIMAIAEKDPMQVIAPVMFTVDAIKWAVVIVSVVWGPAVFLAPWLMLLGLWGVGRRGQAAPQWTLPEAQQDKRDVVPDEGAILDALRNLGIPALNRSFKDGWQPRWVSPTGRLGNGWHTQLQLPLGVTVEMVNSKKKVLAHNLLRLPVEVWPTEPPKQAGVLDLWVADQGSLSGTVPPWPLLTEGTTDYFKGVPVGVTQRGEEVTARLMAANYMFGGIMGAGKSSLVIALLLGAMLDPLVEIDVYVMAFNVDYDPLRPRLRTLVKGDDDEQIKAALNALRDLRNEVTERGKILEELGGESVVLTRELAERDPRMRPKVVVFDECHELFEHKDYGAEAEDLAKKVMKKARKLGITLVWVTVSPTATSIPKEVTRNTSHGVAFAVGDYIANDGILGSGKYKAGITATGLGPIENRGTAVTVGFTHNPFEVVRSYYIKKGDGVDQISPVVARAMELRDGITPATVTLAAEPVDNLADIAAVLGADPRVRSQEVLHRLAALNPAAYRDWSFNDLTAALEPYGAQPYKSHGVSTIARDRVLEALAERDEEAVEDAAE